MNQNKEGVELDIEKLLKNDHPFTIALGNFLVKFEENRPFIPNDIYEFVDEIAIISNKIFAYRIVAPLRAQIGVDSDPGDILDNLETAISNLCDKIRVRIRITEEL